MRNITYCRIAGLSILLWLVLLILPLIGSAQKPLRYKLQETGQKVSFTTTPGEDADYVINPQSFTDHGDGTITDNITGLMWQKTDGGEMTFENAIIYCNNLNLAGFTDWRLPVGRELFAIINCNVVNPAIDTTFFTKTQAEYWWTSEKRANDTTKVWVVNAGGGIGPHPKTETLSAGGTKRFHVRAVRDLFQTQFTAPHLLDNGNGTLRDTYTGLTWQKDLPLTPMSWEDALLYANSFTLAGYSDWRLPTVKELQSLNDPGLVNPSIDSTKFLHLAVGNYWSSTSQCNNPTKAWDLNTQFGIVSYNLKTATERVVLVRGGLDNVYLNINEAAIPAGEYEMGDHFGFIDPQHPSDELPVHLVAVDSFRISKTETTNEQFIAFLNDYYLNGSLQVQNHVVRLAGDTNTLCYTWQYSPVYSISFSNSQFSIADFRQYHPMVGVRWCGAAVYCNWLSLQNGLDPCYNTANWSCDFSKNGYRLPTEAEWEWAARGGHTNPYFNYPNGDTVIGNMTNIPQSGDPYEVGSFPNTTPVGFYTGALQQKTDYNWPGSQNNYQTANGANSFGLFDMQGNVWEFVNDWYGQNYYASSSYSNPTGPVSGFIMPDGLPYRGMRGGNWYNGYTLNGVNDGHSRVSNRNPSYYRGPQDPNHPWYHVGFRTVRRMDVGTGIQLPVDDQGTGLWLSPNPIQDKSILGIHVTKNSHVSLCAYSSTGQLICKMIEDNLMEGDHQIVWDCHDLTDGLYVLVLQTENQIISKKALIIK